MRSFHRGDRFFARNWDDPTDKNDGEKRKVFLDWAKARGYNTLFIAYHSIKNGAVG